MKKQITVKVVVEVDLDAYREAYGNSDPFAEAAEYAAELIHEGAQETAKRLEWIDVARKDSHWTTQVERLAR